MAACLSSTAQCCAVQVLPRVGHAVNTIPNVIQSAADIITGLVTNALNLGTLGLFQRINDTVSINDTTDSILERGTATILSKPYACVLKLINPNAEIDTDRFKNQLTFGRNVRNTFENLGADFAKSESILQREICTRATYLLMPIATVIARVVGFVVGIFAAVASFVCLGKWKAANNVAYANLQVLTVLDDVFSGLTRFINPRPGHQIPTERKIV